jgi:putative oxidoreductase
MKMKIPDRNPDLGLLILRLSLGILMLLHGIAKLIHGTGFIESVVTSAGLPAFVAYGVYIGEIVAPLLIIFGYGTRVAALVYAFTMIVAVGLVHPNEIFALNATGGWGVELPGLYFFGALALVFTGAGKYALSTKHPWD